MRLCLYQNTPDVVDCSSACVPREIQLPAGNVIHILPCEIKKTVYVTDQSGLQVLFDFSVEFPKLDDNLELWAKRTSFMRTVLSSVGQFSDAERKLLFNLFYGTTMNCVYYIISFLKETDIFKYTLNYNYPKSNIELFRFDLFMDMFWPRLK